MDGAPNRTEITADDLRSHIERQTQWPVRGERREEDVCSIAVARSEYEQLLAAFATPPASGSTAGLDEFLEDARARFAFLDKNPNTSFGRADLEFEQELVRWIERLRSALAGVPEGWRLVPKEPTPEMCHVAWDIICSGQVRDMCQAWAAMLAAAPSPPVAQDAGENDALRKLIDAAKALDPSNVQRATVTASQHGNDPLYRDYMGMFERALDEAVQEYEDANRDALSRHAPAPGQAEEDDRWKGQLRAQFVNRQQRTPE